jgi:adenylate cyclase
VLWGLWLYQLVLAHHDQALELARQSMDTAKRRGAPELLGPAHAAMSTSLIWMGRFKEAQEHAEMALGYYDAERDAGSALVYGLDTRVGALIELARTAWFLGLPDEAVRHVDEAIEHALRLGHQTTLAEALVFGSGVNILRMDAEEALARGREAIRVSDDFGLPQWGTAGKIGASWSMVQLGELDEGIRGLEEAMPTWRHIQSRVSMPWFLALLADGLCQAHELERAMQCTEEALEHIYATGEAFFESEVYRIRASILEEMNDPIGAEAAYATGLETARRQGALSMELRNAAAIARIRARRDRAAARALLDPILARFTEGYETFDYREASSLLQALSD